MSSFSSILNRSISFAVALAAGIVSVSFIAMSPGDGPKSNSNGLQMNLEAVEYVRPTGSGSASCSGPGQNSTESSKSETVGRSARTKNYVILSKPKATYTDDARNNSVQGAVRLKVTLLASGQIGSIQPISELPHGLTEQAVAAARKIRFEPRTVNGVPQSVIVTLEYGFNIY